MVYRSLAIALFMTLCAALPAQAGVRIALLPLSVHAAGDDSDYLQVGLAEMIAARLDQYEGISVVRPRVDGTPAREPSTARAAAEGAGAEFVLYGSFTRFGDGASLDLRCLEVAASDDDEAAGERRLFIQSGKLAEIIPQLDTLAQKVARYALQSSKAVVTGAADGKSPVALPGPTTAQYEALVKRIEALEGAPMSSVPGAPEESSASVR